MAALIKRSLAFLVVSNSTPTGTSNIFHVLCYVFFYKLRLGLVLRLWPGFRVTVSKYIRVLDLLSEIL